MFFKTLSTHGGNFHSHQPHVSEFSTFYSRNVENGGNDWKPMRKNLEKQLDLTGKTRGRRTEKHDSLYAFLKSSEQVLNSCWKNWWKHGKAQFITAF